MRPVTQKPKQEKDALQKSLKDLATKLREAGNKVQFQVDPYEFPDQGPLCERLCADRSENPDKNLMCNYSHCGGGNQEWRKPFQKIAAEYKQLADKLDDAVTSATRKGSIDQAEVAVILQGVLKAYPEGDTAEVPVCAQQLLDRLNQPQAYLFAAQQRKKSTNDEDGDSQHDRREPDAPPPTAKAPTLSLRDFTSRKFTGDESSTFANQPFSFRTEWTKVSQDASLANGLTGGLTGGRRAVPSFGSHDTVFLQTDASTEETLPALSAVTGKEV